MSRHCGTGGTGLNGSEKWMVIKPPGYTSGGRLCITGFGQENASPYNRLRDLQALANAGFLVVCADLRGSNQWSNDTQLTGVSDIISWAATNHGANTSKVSWVGDSRFACCALNWAWRNTSQVGALALRIPVVALDAFHDRNAFGLATEIETAYGGLSGYNTAVPSRDPSHPNQTAAITAMSDKIRCWYSTDDPIVLPSDVTSFADLTGVEIRPLGPVGHDPWTPGAIHADAQAAWMLSRL